MTFPKFLAATAVLIAALFVFSCKPSPTPSGDKGADQGVDKKMADLIKSPTGAKPAGHPDMSGMKMGGEAGGAPKAPLPIVVPDEVKKAVKKVRINIKKKDGSADQTIEAAIDQETKLGDSGLTVKVLAYLPAFYMDTDRISSVSSEPTNPAAKVVISENGKEIHTGWLFSKMPGVHAFEHPTWAVTLVDAVVEK